MEQTLKEMVRVKERMFTIVLRGEFEIEHSKLVQQKKKRMKYKWRKYNTVLRFVLGEEKVYKDCHDYVYLCQYFNSQLAPEAKVESSFSILKALLQGNGLLKIKDINRKFKIIDYFYVMYSDECRAFIDQTAAKWLQNNRSPFVKKRSKFEFSEVLDKILKPLVSCFGGNIEDFDYSSSEDDDNDDYNVMEDPELDR